MTIKVLVKWLSGMVACLLLLSGCTSHLYTGFATYSLDNKRCDAMIYWHNTQTWFNNTHDNSAIVIRLASSHRTFIFAASPLPSASEEPRWLILPNDLFEQSKFGPSVLSTLNELPVLAPTDVNCGYISTGIKHDNSHVDEAYFTFICDALEHPLKRKPAIMPASPQAYVFKMQPVTTKFSWLGEHLPVEAELNCQPL